MKRGRCRCAGGCGLDSLLNPNARLSLLAVFPTATVLEASSWDLALSSRGHKALYDAAVVSESFRSGKPGQVQIPEGVEPGARIQCKAPWGDAWPEMTATIRFVVFVLDAWLVMVCS